MDGGVADAGDVVTAAQADEADEADVDPWDFGRFRAWLGSSCEFLPSDAADCCQGPWEPTTDAQVMVIGTELDPDTGG